MKKVFLTVVLLISFLASSYCQTAINGTSIPNFKMLLTNGKYFTDKDIQKNKPFVLIYFAPDCDHCTVLMDQLFKRIHDLDKATVMLVSFKPLQELQAFERKYNTAKYKNIKVGTEGTAYVLRNYYRLQKTPFTAVYDKKGKLAYSYKDETPVTEMLGKLKKV